MALTVIGGAICLLAPAEPHYQNKTLQDHFDRLQGYNGDPVIQKLRDIGPDAVAFLTHQMKRKDSFVRDRYAALWPKLPAFVRSRTKQPVSVAEIRVKVVSALRQMGPSFTGSDIGFSSLVAGYDGHRGWICSVAVAPTHRKQGIGSRLVAHAEAALAGKGCGKINLQIMDGNEGVASFYSTLGYAVEKRVSMGKRITGNIPPT